MMASLVTKPSRSPINGVTAPTFGSGNRLLTTFVSFPARSVTIAAQAAGSSGAAGVALAAGIVELVNRAATSESAVIVFFTATFFLNAQFTGAAPEMPTRNSGAVHSMWQSVCPHTDPYQRRSRIHPLEKGLIRLREGPESCTRLSQVTSSDQETKKTDTSGHPARRLKANWMPCVDLSLAQLARTTLPSSADVANRPWRGSTRTV